MTQDASGWTGCLRESAAGGTLLGMLMTVLIILAIIALLLFIIGGVRGRRY